MNRFFVDRENIKSDEIIITGPDVRHIVGPLRMELGDSLEVVGEGDVYIGEISLVERDEIRLKILEKKLGENEPRTKICLYQGLAKGSKMDFILQKCTELGVSEFYGLETERAVVRLDQKKKKSKLEKWQKTIDEASKQSKRDIIPKIRDIVSLDQALKDLEGETIIVFYEDEEDQSIRQVLKDIKSQKINILVGPEGGFAEEEIESIKSVGGRVASLGKRILRTETAGIVGATTILYEFGDI